MLKEHKKEKILPSFISLKAVVSTVDEISIKTLLF